jgi:hypothetical protein
MTSIIVTLNDVTIGCYTMRIASPLVLSLGAGDDNTIVVDFTACRSSCS